VNLHAKARAAQSMRKFRHSFASAGRDAFVRAFALLITTFSAACAASPAAPSDVASVSSATFDLSAELAFCAEEVNRYRASVGLKSLIRSAGLESFAARAAEHDGTAHMPHQLFASTGGGGMAMAETEILWWRGYAVRAVIKQGLAQMWKVGPNGEHYNILSGNYAEVGCGVFINDGEVTVTQDFR
jgi:hypothetical protein